MPNTKLTKKVLSNHYQYGKMAYLGLAIIAWMLADLMFTTTEYRSPNERKVDIELVGQYSNPEGLSEVAQLALIAGQTFETERAIEQGLASEGTEYEAPLEEVNFYSIAYSGADDDVYGVQKYMVMLAAQEGDIYFVNRALMEDLVTSGVALPLDDYIASGVLDPGDRDLSRVTYDEPVENEGDAPTGLTHVYALQADPLYALMGDGSDILYDVRDTYMVITAYSKNPDTVAAVMQSLMDQLETEKPQWLIDYEAAQAAADQSGEGEADVSTED